MPLVKTLNSDGTANGVDRLRFEFGGTTAGLTTRWGGMNDWALASLSFVCVGAGHPTTLGVAARLRARPSFRGEKIRPFAG